MRTMTPDRPQRLVFGEVADRYDQHRPTYPDALFDLLIGLGPVDGVLDVGAGTGRVAAAFAARGLPGLAVEPSAEMASVARANLPETWTVEESDFETCDGGGRRWPLITCGQAWHWIDHARGLARARSLLGDGGHLALFWNRGEFIQDDLRAEMDEVYDRLAPDMQSSLRGRGAPAKGRLPDDIGSKGPPAGFVAVDTHGIQWEQTYTTHDWVALLGTHSDHRLLPDDVRRELHAAVANVIDRHGGSFVLPYRVAVTIFST